jgi:hypothetical protein
MADYTLKADMVLSEDYYFRPVDSVAVTEFEIYHDNGKSGKNLNDCFIWQSGSGSFTVSASAR